MFLEGSVDDPLRCRLGASPAAECLQIHIHGKDDVVHCSCLYYRITKVKEVDIACALIYAKELAHKEIELNKNKYKIEDTAAKA